MEKRTHSRIFFQILKNSINIRKIIQNFLDVTNPSKIHQCFFHCDDCYITNEGVYCVFCFNKTKHTNHHVSVLYESSAFCDCGNPKTIKKECWCPNHDFGPLNPNFPYEKSLFISKIREIYQKVIEIHSNIPLL